MSDATDLEDWVGRTEVADDILRPEPARFMQATLDRVPSLMAQDELPPLWHWLYFLEARRSGVLGRDGHPKRGDFLPPVSLPRRMWAGGRFEFHAPLVLGNSVTRHSKVIGVSQKQGRTGPLCFVTVEHTYIQGEQPALREEHDIVYRADPKPGVVDQPPAAARENPDVSRSVTPSEVLLFRYSALTLNGHRIHYDAEYARAVEGYAGLVFHGPLTATLLIDLAMSLHDRAPKRFEFRGHAPISGMAAFHIEARLQENTADLWAKREDGALAMTANAVF